MKIVLLSDTHAYTDAALEKHLEEADEIWHAGDLGSHELVERFQAYAPFRAVYGNIDDGVMRKRFPENAVFNCGGLKVWMTHIGGYPPNYSAKIRQGLHFHQPDLFICGHSHILKIIPDKPRRLLHINPGAAGRHGFHKVRTLVRFSIDHQAGEGLQKIKNLQVVELGPRASF